MKRLVPALWLAASLLLVAGFYFSREAEALTGAVQVAQRRADSVAPPKTGSLPLAVNPSPGSAPPARSEIDGVASGNLRVKSAPALRDGQQPTVRFTSNQPNPEANAAEAGIRIRLRYHAMYLQLGLNSEQIARFEEAMRTKPFATDVFMLNLMAPEQEERLLGEKMLVVDDVVRTTLGESQVAEVRRYIATADLQEVADKLAVNTFASGSPLTAAQADQLVQACLALRSNSDQAVTRVDPRTVDWPAVLERAGSFLAPPQLSALRAMVDQRNFDRVYSEVTGGSRRPPVRNF